MRKKKRKKKQKQQLTAKVGAPPVHAHAALPTEARVGRDELTHVRLFASLLLAPDQEHLHGNVGVAGFEHLRAERLASHGCPRRTHCPPLWQAHSAFRSHRPVRDKRRLVRGRRAATQREDVCFFFPAGSFQRGREVAGLQLVEGTTSDWTKPNESVFVLPQSPAVWPAAPALLRVMVNSLL